MQAPKLRVLVVDDSVVVRQTLKEVLPFEMVGPAANGKIALAMIPQLNPDVIILDIEMPEMNGLQTLAAIRREYKSLPVIMFSTLSSRNAVATLDALELGATDYVLKPSSIGGRLQGLVAVTAELIDKIRQHCAPAASVLKTAPRSVAAPPPRPHPEAAAIVALGVSTGGPNALAAVLPLLPADLPVPVVIVQHMPRVFTRFLAERLAAKCRIGIAEGRDGEPLEPGRAWIAPGDYHMGVKAAGNQVVIEINQNPPENSCRPAVDVLFRSVARVFGHRALAVVMTGMGQDGLRGCELIRQREGAVLVQDESSSVVWGMPGAVAQAGLAESIVPLADLAQTIMQRVRNPTGHRAQSAIRRAAQ